LRYVILFSLLQKQELLCVTWLGVVQSDISETEFELKWSVFRPRDCKPELGLELSVITIQRLEAYSFGTRKSSLFDINNLLGVTPCSLVEV